MLRPYNSTKNCQKYSQKISHRSLSKSRQNCNLQNVILGSQPTLPNSLLKNIHETVFWNYRNGIIFDREIFFGRQWQYASQMKLEGFDFWSTKGKMHFSRYMAPLDGEALKKTLCSLKEAERHQQCLCISEHALCSQQYQINLSCFSGLAWVTFQKGGWMRFW